jgi:ubiquinone biosynthesis monooxygenase Coq7
MLDRKKLSEIIRVNHAGEFGGKVIYDGQIAALKLKRDHKTADLVRHMKQQEDIHFDYFNNEIKQQKIRPTVMQPIWKVGGFALGFLTAMLDKKAAMCCTTAVEEVIDDHYQDQLKLIAKEEKFLSEEEKLKIKNLKEKIEKFRAEELEHRDIGYEHKASDLPYFKPLSTAIKMTTKFAIAVSKKI